MDKLLDLLLCYDLTDDVDRVLIYHLVLKCTHSVQRILLPAFYFRHPSSWFDAIARAINEEGQE